MKKLDPKVSTLADSEISSQSTGFFPMQSVVGMGTGRYPLNHFNFVHLSYWFGGCLLPNTPSDSKQMSF